MSGSSGTASKLTIRSRTRTPTEADERPGAVHAVAPHEVAGRDRRKASRRPRGRHDGHPRRADHRRPDGRSRFSSSRRTRGARAVRRDSGRAGFRGGERSASGVLDLAIVGGGVSGVAAAIEAKKAGLDYRVFEATEPFATVVNFPKGKPIYTYPIGMTPSGGLQFRSEVHPKEQLLADLERERREGRGRGHERAHRADRARRRPARAPSRRRRQDRKPGGRSSRSGKSGDHRRLGVPGENLDKVFNRLHDPKDFAGQQVARRRRRRLRPRDRDRAGGGARHARAVTSSRYRNEDPSGRPKRPSTVLEHASVFWNAAGAVRLALGTQVVRIEPEHVVLKDDAGKETRLENDVVFTMIGREAPLDFFRRSGHPDPRRVEGHDRSGLRGVRPLLRLPLQLEGERSGQPVLPEARTLPVQRRPALDAIRRRLPGTLSISLRDPGFYYSFAYCMAVLVFGIRAHPAPQDALRHAADDRSHGRSSGSRSSCCPT